MAFWIGVLLVARILTCGFEEVTAITDIEETMWTSASGTPEIQTTTVRSGVNALRIAAGAARQLVRNLSATVTSGTYFVRASLRIAGAPSLDNRELFAIFSSGLVDGPRLQMDTNRTLELVNVVTGTVITGPVLAVDTWYRVEIRYVISDTVGELELQVDGVSFGTITNEDTLPTNVGRFGWGSDVANFGADVFWDDIIINDATGAAPFNTWPGDSKIALAEPGGEDSMQWENGAAGTPSLYTNVDDQPGLPDDATTYNMENDTASQVDRMTLATLPAEIPSDANMIALDLYMRVGGDGTTARNITNKIWDEAGVLTNGPLISAAISGWRIASVGPTNEHQAFDLGARTKANVQDFDVGYDNNSVNETRERRVTSLWVQVEWIEGAPAAGVPYQPWSQRGPVVAQ